MASLHNDLSSWAAKAKLQGYRVEITPKLAEALGELVRAAGAMEGAIPAHWHDDATIEFRDAIRAAEKAR